jgi:predicted DNA-binding transcriptional regulator YafY
VRAAERLVLTWAPDCEALAPEELRESVAKALAEGARMHSRRSESRKGKR